MTCVNRSKKWLLLQPLESSKVGNQLRDSSRSYAVGTLGNLRNLKSGEFSAPNLAQNTNCVTSIQNKIRNPWKMDEIFARY